MILVDSTVWIAYFNGIRTWQTDLLDEILDQEMIAAGDLILAEVLQGFRSEQDFKHARHLFSILPCYEMVGIDHAVKSAGNYRILRKQGITVRKTIDMLIATFCISMDLSLLHDDRDFDVMEEHLGLKVEPVEINVIES